MNLDLHTHTTRYSICSEMDPTDLIYRVKDSILDGVVIPAHIYRYGRKVKLDELQLMNVYGLEVKSNNITYDEMKRSIRYAEKLNLCQIAGSDGHSTGDIGRYFTRFDGNIQSERDLVYAIKNNLCDPIIGEQLGLGKSV